MPAARWNEITETLRTAIDGGELQPGDRLPTESELGIQWKVSRPTANHAVQEL